MVDFFFKKMYFAPMQKEATATLVMRYFQSRHGKSLVITFSSIPNFGKDSILCCVECNKHLLRCVPLLDLIMARGGRDGRGWGGGGGGGSYLSAKFLNLDNFILLLDNFKIE